MITIDKKIEKVIAKQKTKISSKNIKQYEKALKTYNIPQTTTPNLVDLQDKYKPESLKNICLK